MGGGGISFTWYNHDNFMCRARLFFQFCVLILDFARGVRAVLSTVRANLPGCSRVGSGHSGYQAK
jgi:hypothetical protein